MIDIEQFIRDVPDFPKKGIIFKDITPLLGNYEALAATVEQLAEPYLDAGVQYVTGVESRGFIFGVALAERLRCGFVPIRKPGKLPAEVVAESYELEYGSDSVEMHADAMPAGAKVLMIDDLLATGGTMAAACKLVDRIGGKIVGVAFVVELCFLNGRDKLQGYDVRSLIKVRGE